MNKISNSTFQNVPVSLDGIHYDHCQFTNCALVFHGQNLFSLTNCTFNGCWLRMDEFALNTVTMLSVFYHTGFRPLVEMEIERIQKGDYLPPNFLKQQPAQSNPPPPAEGLPPDNR